MPSTRFIIFPEDDEEYNKWAIYYMPVYLQRERFDRVVILTCSDKLTNNCKKMSYTHKKVVQIEESKMQCLMKFAGLVNMNDQWTIISVTQPYDTYAERLLGRNGVTKRDIVWYDIYKMAKDQKYKR